jgi:hypothetical protein
MIPGVPTATIYGGPRSDDFIKQIKAQDAVQIQMGRALGNFLAAAFPHAAACARTLEEAYIALMTVGSARQIEILEAQHAAMESYRPSPASLTRLVEQRDQLQGQLDKAHAAVEIMAESMPDGYSTLVESTMIQPIKDRLDSINEQISMVQAELERSQTS